MKVKNFSLTQPIARKGKKPSSFHSTAEASVIYGSLLSVAIASMGIIAPTVAQQNPRSTSQTAIPSTPTPGINRPTLKIGSRGTVVAELQAALKLLGYYAGEVDGTYSESTATAVSRFQQAAGLKVDGIVGSATWERLFPPTPPNRTQTATQPITAPTPPNRTQTVTQPITTAITAPTPTPSPAASITAASFPRPSLTSPSQPASNETTAIAAQPPVGELPTLKRGMRGPAVFWLQQRLQTIGVFQDPIDGIFGSATEDAVKVVQQRNRLNSDGIVGDNTWRVLLP